MRYPTRSMAVLLACLCAATGSWAAEPAKDYKLEAPRFVRTGKGDTLQGRICRVGLGRPGAPQVEILQADAPQPRLNVAQARIYGDLRGRAGGCASYVANITPALGPLRVCVSSSLGGGDAICEKLYQ